MISFLLALVAGLATPALAEPEVHFVGIYEGFTRSDGRIHGPKARVLLDRPGAEVVLVLSSDEATLWDVRLSEGTAMPSVVLSQMIEDRQGAVLVNGQNLDQPVRMKLPLEMPTVSWPMGAVRDAATGTLYGVTLGGEGFLYAHEETTGTWRIVRSMAQMDAQALFLDAAGRRLVMPLGLGAPGRLALLDLKVGDAAPVQIVELQDDLVGLTDLYDSGNGPAPDLVPLGIEGDRLLLLARDDWSLGPGWRSPGDPTPAWRAWLADLSSGTAALVGYGDGAPPPE